MCSFISPMGEQSTVSEISLLTALNNLATSPAGQFIRKTGASSFENASAASAFTGLTDVPSSYSGQSGKGVRVNALATGLEFYSIGAINVSDTVYGASWDGDTTVAPSKNAVYDKIESLSAGVGGSGTINELAYWSAATTLGTLAVATYPSLTELSYVKGVSSAIQTQISAKAPSTAPTFATSITGSYLTASEMLITDGSKNIVSAPVATYPSLTELSYVKGVTSAIQTQLNAKAATLAGTINEIAYFNSASTIASLAVATYPSLTELSYVKGVSSAIQTQIGNKLDTSAFSDTGVTGKLITGFVSGAGAVAATDTILQAINKLDGNVAGKQTTHANLTSLAALSYVSASFVKMTAAGTFALDTATYLTSGGALGTPSSGTGTNITGIPAANILAGSFGAGAYVISTSLQAATIELGHATDTTISRVSAGVIAVEGNTIYAAGGTDVAFADGGTGISSWTQYLIPYAATTTSIGQIAIGTAGQVLTSNGAGAAPTFQAAGGGIPTMKISTVFETSARSVSGIIGSGAITFGGRGVQVDTGATGTSSATISWSVLGSSGGINFGLYSGNPSLSVAADCANLTTASGAGSTFIGMGEPTVSGSGHTYTDRHIGFKILKTGGVVSLYATQADNTTENASAALSASITTNSKLDLIMKVNSTTSVDYYWRLNGGSLSSATNLTSNMPTDASESVCQFSNSNNDTAFTYRIDFGAASYER